MRENPKSLPKRVSEMKHLTKEDLVTILEFLHQKGLTIPIAQATPVSQIQMRLAAEIKEFEKKVSPEPVSQEEKKPT